MNGDLNDLVIEVEVEGEASEDLLSTEIDGHARGGRNGGYRHKSGTLIKTNSEAKEGQIHGRSLLYILTSIALDLDVNEKTGNTTHDCLADIISI